MNCQPGDLAIVSKECRWKGKLLEVMYSRPPQGCDYTLPNGTPARVTSAGPGWVVRLLEPMPVLCLDGVTRMATYGDCPDAYLKPLRGLPEDVEVHDTSSV